MTTAAWSVHTLPFRHVQARNVFEERTYDRLVESFKEIKARGASDPSTRLAKTPGSTYDALTLAMRQDLRALFSPIFDADWLAMLAARAGLRTADVTTAVDGGLHHIPKGSSSGWVHHDCCSGWFNGPAPAEGVHLPDRRMVDYFLGTPRRPQAQPVEYIRSASMIYYLMNDGWKAGMGGETGLYPGSKAAFGRGAYVPPVNNSLVLFQCSPHSYHRLAANPGLDRHSVVLWLHSTVDVATARWDGGITRRAPS
jgi:hypothetical protein